MIANLLLFTLILFSILVFINLYKTNRTKFFIVIYLYLLGILYFSNPNYLDHKVEFIKDFKNYYDENPDFSLYERRKAEDLDTFLENYLKVTNCYFFSISYMYYEGKNYPIGIGIFGQIINFKKIEEIYISF